MGAPNDSTKALESTMNNRIRTRLIKTPVMTDTNEPGVFLSTRSLASSDLYSSGSDENHYNSSSHTEVTPECFWWRSCDKLDHNIGAPLIVTSPESGHNIEDEAAELGTVLAKSRRLPSTNSCWFASNHIMVNNERTSHMVAPLTRLSDLDSIARKHAETMAAEGRLFHSNPQEIQSCFTRTSRRFGENVARGGGIREVHEAMMKNRSDRNNILDRRYTNMGMGTARGSDGFLYLAQVFRG